MKMKTPPFLPDSAVVLMYGGGLSSGIGRICLRGVFLLASCICLDTGYGMVWYGGGYRGEYSLPVACSPVHCHKGGQDADQEQDKHQVLSKTDVL